MCANKDEESLMCEYDIMLLLDIAYSINHPLKTEALNKLWENIN